MAGKREFETTFSVNAKLGSGYQSTFKGATVSISEVQRELATLSKAQADVSSYMKQRAAIVETGVKLSNLKAEYDDINKRITENRGTTRDLRGEYSKNQQGIGQTSFELSKLNVEYQKIQKEMEESGEASEELKTALNKKKEEIDKTKDKLEKLNDEHNKIQKAMQKSGDVSDQLKSALGKKKEEIDKTSKSISTQSERLNKLDNSMRNAGFRTDDLVKLNNNLSSNYERLSREQRNISSGFTEAGKSAAFFGDKTVSAVDTIQSAFVAAGIVAVTSAIKNKITEAIGASIEYESAITGVYKTVSGTPKELENISSGIKELATVIPATTTEIAAVAETAGQLGIKTGAVLDFTKVMIDLGETTNLSASEAASSLAKFANITGTASENYNRLGSVIVALGNNFATTEADIVEMSTRLASAGKLAGLSEANIMALATAMSSVGIEAEAGGTAMTQTLDAIEKATIKGGDTLKQFADIAGMSADEFAATWNNDAISAIQAFISGLGSLEQRGESATLVLDKLGLSGIRQSNMLKSLALTADKLSSTVSMANSAWIENNALASEAALRYGTTESGLATLKNAYSNLSVAVGDVYAPALQKAIEFGTNMLKGITRFVEKNPGVVKAITGVTIGVVTFSGALVAYTVASNAARSATKALTAAMQANPLLLAATAVLGVVAAVASLATISGEATSEVDQFTEASTAASEALEKANKAFSKNRDEIEASSSLVSQYVDRLEELEEKGLNSAYAQQEYHNTVALINEIMPDLNVSIDENTGLIAGGTKAVRDNTKALRENAIAKAFDEKYETIYRNQATALIEYQKNQNALNDAKEKMGRLNVRLNAGNKALELGSARLSRMTEREAESYYEFADSISELQREYDELKRSTEIYSIALEENQAVIDNYNNEISELNKLSASFQVTSNSMAADTKINSEEISSYLQLVTQEAGNLAAAYEKSYESALESIRGQYAIWDEAATEISISAEDINKAIMSQALMWENYDANLSALGERSAEVEGLSKVLASFADGSKESVAAIAGMATATDEELKELTRNWHLLQKQEEKAADSLANTRDGYKEKLEAFRQDVVATIEQMDLSDEATESGKSTIQGFINSVDTMMPAVKAAYSRLASSIINEFDKSLNGVSVDVAFTRTGKSQITGAYASGTNSAERGLALVGENGPELVNFNGGEVVYDAEKTRKLIDAYKAYGAERQQVITLSPHLMQAMTAVRAYEKENDIGVETYNNESNNVTYANTNKIEFSINININGSVPENIREELEVYSNEIADKVMERLEDTGINARRSAYRW